MYEKKNVIVICQSAVGQMYFGALLNRIGYMPIFSRTASESSLLARETSISVLLLDGDLPDPERTATVSFLRQDPVMKELPLVIALADGSSTVRDSLMYEGCTAIISKPLDVSLVYGIFGRLTGEPRQSPRIPIRLRVEIEEQTPDKFLTSVDMSENGIFLRTYKVLPENTLLHLAFTLPHDAENIQVAAEVARQAPLGAQFDSEPGIGLKFTTISEKDRSRIRNFIKWTLTGDLEWDLEISEH